MTPEKRKEAHRADTGNLSLYHWYKAHGICIACGHEDAEPGKTRCAECAMKAAAWARAAYYLQSEEQKAANRQQRKERYARRKALGLCTDCGKTVSTGKRLCLDCSLRRRYVKTDFSDGLCCKCNEPVVPGMMLCARHYAIAAANARKAHAQRPNENHP